MGKEVERRIHVRHLATAVLVARGHRSDRDKSDFWAFVWGDSLGGSLVRFEANINEVTNTAVCVYSELGSQLR